MSLLYIMLFLRLRFPPGWWGSRLLGCRMADRVVEASLRQNTSSPPPTAARGRSRARCSPRSNTNPIQTQCKSNSTTIQPSANLMQIKSIANQIYFFEHFTLPISQLLFSVGVYWIYYCKHGHWILKNLLIESKIWFSSSITEFIYEIENMISSLFFLAQILF